MTRSNSLEDLMPATYVALNATVQMAGFSTKNWDVERDRCELHLHEKTGGVFVRRGEEFLFISPALISHVELRVEEASTQSGPSAEPFAKDKRNFGIAPASRTDMSRDIDRSVAMALSDDATESDIDAVLREIAGNVASEDAAPATPRPPRRAPRRAKK